MNFSAFVARRYLFSKKRTNAINIISVISVVGVAVATMALVVVLSVFNGFHDLVASFFTNFDPQLKIVPVKGKSVPADDPLLTQLCRQPEVAIVSACVEDQALAVYGDRQAMVTVKGVDDHFADLTHVRNILYGNGEFELHAGNLQYGIPGIRLAQDMGLGAMWNGFMSIYAPKREGQPDMANPTDGFVVDSLISPGVVFAVGQGKYDKSTLLTSISFARELFGQQGMVTSMQLDLKDGSNLQRVKRRMRNISAGHYRVLDRYEQQADTFKIMQIEKLLAYLFLTFILVVACFNIIGSLSMLIIDKRDDVQTLRNLGATDRQITRIFLYEGRMITALGAVVGIALGLLLCGLQQAFGFVSMGNSAGTFVVDAYPVSVHYTDILVIGITVIAVGWISAAYPVRYLAKRLLSD